MTSKINLIICAIVFSFLGNAVAQNPLVNDQFTADPTARVFEGKVYVYPSHDINCGTNWFCMKDYHVFSSGDLVNWTDHGVIVSQDEVAWVDTSANAMWAPDAIEKDGTYYFYFPAIADSAKTGIEGRKIGVAISESPAGPYKPQKRPIKGVNGIDPNVFIDRDGQAYLYWAEGELYVAKLKDNMLELASEPKVIANLPEKGLKEGPFVFERNGIYYLTYPHVAHNTERLEYAMGDSPMGPFEVTGVIMDESPDCWTNHHSILSYDNQWYLFYHHNDYSPDFDKNRSIRADSLFFNPDGTIQKVTPTLRGVGLTDAGTKIQIDRYTDISENGTSVAFLDTSDTFKGWKTIFDNRDGWIRYDAVDFGEQEFREVGIRVKSTAGGSLAIHLDRADGPRIAEIKLPKTKGWETIKSKVSGLKPGTHNLIITAGSNSPVEIDWLSFE